MYKYDEDLEEKILRYAHAVHKPVFDTLSRSESGLTLGALFEEREKRRKKLEIPVHGNTVFRHFEDLMYLPAACILFGEAAAYSEQRKYRYKTRILRRGEMKGDFIKEMPSFKKHLSDYIKKYEGACAKVVSIEVIAQLDRSIYKNYFCTLHLKIKDKSDHLENSFDIKQSLIVSEKKILVLDPHKFSNESADYFKEQFDIF